MFVTASLYLLTIGAYASRFKIWDSQMTITDIVAKKIEEPKLKIIKEIFSLLDCLQ